MFSHSCQCWWLSSLQTLERNSQPGCMQCVQLFSSVILICSKSWRATHILSVCSMVPVSSSDLLKHQRATHILNMCSVILISGFNLLKHRKMLTCWMCHVCSPILISGSDLLKHWRTTHSLDESSGNFKIYLNLLSFNLPQLLPNKENKFKIKQKTLLGLTYSLLSYLISGLISLFHP